MKQEISDVAGSVRPDHIIDDSVIPKGSLPFPPLNDRKRFYFRFPNSSAMSE